ncbi:uncharacterized protein KZ484_017162 [Pholidichthys leucotaenia]
MPSTAAPKKTKHASIQTVEWCAVSRDPAAKFLRAAVQLINAVRPLCDQCTVFKCESMNWADETHRCQMLAELMRDSRRRKRENYRNLADPEAEQFLGAALTIVTLYARIMKRVRTGPN